MRLKAREGDKVKFTGRGGTPLEYALTREYFDPDQVLTVKEINIGASFTYICFEECPNVAFNSVLFEDM